MPAHPHARTGPDTQPLPPWARRVGRLSLGLALLLAPLYGLLLLTLWLAQERLLFQPQVLPPGTTLATEPDVHELSVAVPGAQLSVLQLRLAEPQGVVFFLHGNSGSLANWFVNTRLYREAGFDLVMMDYRGFGKSSGRIRSETELHDDVWAVWQQVAPRYAGKRVIVYGRSLGTGLAARLATRLQPELTVLVSPYQSLQALALQHYPWVPAPLLRYPMRSDRWLPQVKSPLLLVHGEQDTLIPPAHSQVLLPLAGGPARLALIPGAAHGDLQDVAAYRDVIAQALAGR